MTESTTTKRKRSSNSNSGSHSNNPLAKARGKQQSHENIWFRRTGAGKHLFVQYYHGQPDGTVCPKGESTTVAAPTAKKETSGAGLSRAAKRRKKKKQKNHGDEVATTTTTTTQTATNSPTATQSNSNHPLLQAMTKQLSPNQTRSPLRLQSFLDSMSKPLPVTFRLRRTLTRKDSQELQDTLDSETYSSIVHQLPFGNGLLYQARQGIAKADLKQHPHLKEWLVQGSRNGQVARQELGSMLPVLALEQTGAFVLRDRKRLKVLDVCASPGSKTLQALELLLKLEHPRSTQKSRILANDVSESRLTSLRDAIERSGVPLQYSEEDSGNIIGYSCADARHLSTTNSTGKKQSQWDVIICDVPCSGDGTIRKDPHILQLWKPSQGQALHQLQVQILLRALQLVRPCRTAAGDESSGGTICYSTCSLNPVENEAVVWEALQQYNTRASKSNTSQKGPAAEIMDFPAIPGFTRRSGITTWRVADYHDDTRYSNAKNETNDNDEEDETPKLSWYDTYEEAETAGMVGALPSMWPPSTKASSNSTAGIDLTRCTRLWPQDHDSGGFFLSLIRRNW